MTNPDRRNTTGAKGTSTRRSLLTRLWALLGLVALVELFGMVLTFLRPQPKSTNAGTQDPIITAGPVDSFEPETVTAFVRGKFYLARLADGGFLALSRTEQQRWQRATLLIVSLAEGTETKALWCHAQ